MGGAWEVDTFNDGAAAWRADTRRWAESGIHVPTVVAYVPEAWKRDYRLALDELPQAVAQARGYGYDALPVLTTDPNSAVPMMLTTLIDPEVFRVLFAPMKIASILGEEKRGDWLTETAMFIAIQPKC
jgi:hypothetical protein